MPLIPRFPFLNASALRNPVPAGFSGHDMAACHGPVTSRRQELLNPDNVNTGSKERRGSTEMEKRLISPARRMIRLIEFP